MGDDGLTDIDPTVKRWIIRKYKDGASRKEIKEGLRGSVDDLAVVDSVIDSGAVQREPLFRDNLFQQSFLTVWRASVEAVFNRESSFFERIENQPSYQALGIVFINSVIFSLLPMSFGFVFGGLSLAEMGSTALMMVVSSTGFFLFLGSTSGFIARELGGSFVASFNTSLVMSSLLFLSYIPIIGLFVWIVFPFLYVSFMKSANGFSTVRSFLIVIIVVVAAIALATSLMTFTSLPWKQIVEGFV